MTDLPPIDSSQLAKLYTLWDSFLQRWPISSLSAMTIDQYTNLAKDDSFTYWVEARLNDLGSIWGNSAFKFGIFRRSSREPKVSGSMYRYTQEYAWRAQLGATPEQAFERVRADVVAVATHAAAGDFAAIDRIKMMPLVKWKLAFLYQSREKAIVFPVYAQRALRLIHWHHVRSDATELPPAPPRSVQYRELRERFPEIKDVIELGMRLWADHAERHVLGQGDVDDDESETETAPEPGDHQAALPSSPRNIIRCGPPGTGKTYGTARRALQLLRWSDVDEMTPARVSKEFQGLVAEGRIAMVTFHQSYSYEDFIEGLRPVLDSTSGEVRYELHAGIFKQMALRAAAAGLRTAAAEPSFDLLWQELLRRVRADEDRLLTGAGGKEYVLRITSNENFETYRSSLDAESKEVKVSEIRQTASRSLASLWWEHRSELGPPEKLSYERMAEFLRSHRGGSGGHHYTALWIVYKELLALRDELMTERAQAKPSLAQVQAALDRPASGDSEFAFGPETPQFVLVIDEINRGNVSKVLGELITLLEPDKRLGMPNEMRVPLAYSPEHFFAVPPNLHVIATMNTADRSIALMDVALRRRFEFEEVMPSRDALKEVLDAREVSAPLSRLVVELLETLNARIRLLYDREHQIGHAYFMGVETLDDLRRVLVDRVVPLLSEYFYGRWDKVAAVLGCPYDDAGRALRRGVPTESGRYRHPVVSAHALQPESVLGYATDEHEVQIEYAVVPALIDGTADRTTLARVLLGILSAAPDMETRVAELAGTSS